MIKITLHCGQYTATGDYKPKVGFVTSVKWSKNEHFYDKLLVPEMTAEIIIYELRKLSAYFDANMDANSNFAYERRLTGREQVGA